MRFTLPHSGFLLSLALFASGCASVALTAPETAAAAERQAATEDADDLAVVMRNDLARATHRTHEREETLRPRVASLPLPESPRVLPRDVTQFFAPLTELPIPVAGLSARDLEDSWGRPRDGGRRRHRGIDIFAPRGTQVVAVADGTVSFVGTQPKGGHCLWLVDEHTGYAYFYAHLDRFAGELREGAQVRRGEVLGHVGNTGNARRSTPHLHFAVLKDDEAVNPYPLLTRSVSTAAAPVLSGGFAAGSASER
jgi:murein DD-endopeptidase MepM/ murein hydrolase activator NlpD